MKILKEIYLFMPSPFHVVLIRPRSIAFFEKKVKALKSPPLKICDGLKITLGQFFSTPEFDNLEQEIA